MTPSHVEIVDQHEFGGADPRSAEAHATGIDFWLSEIGRQWVCQTLHAQPVTVIAKKGDAKAYLPCFLRKPVAGLTFVSGYPYCHVFGDIEAFGGTHDSLRAACKRRGVARLEFTFSGAGLASATHLASANCGMVEASDKAEYSRQIVDIAAFAGSEDFSSGLDRKLRWSVKKAKKEGVTTEILRNQTADEAQRIYTNVMREKGAPAYYGVSRLQFIIDELTNINRGAVYQARLGNRVVGMAAVVYAQRSAHLKQLAVLREFNRFRVGDLLIAQVQFDAAKSGCQYFDFMATPSYEPGVEEFKKKWGGDNESVTTLQFDASPRRAQAIDILRGLSRRKNRLTALSRRS